MSYAIRNDGLGWRSVNSPADLEPDETFSTTHPAPADDTVKHYEIVLDAYLDAIARQHRYDSRITFALRAGYAGPYQAEGIAFAQWMDACYVASNQIKNAVLAGEQQIPSIDDFLQAMPVFVLP